MSSEVTELIAKLRAGTMTLEGVAQRFRQRSWPRRERPVPKSYLQLAQRAQEDPDPYVDGSFDDVVAAYMDGTITEEEYAVLSEAVADSKKAEDRRER